MVKSPIEPTHPMKLIKIASSCWNHPQKSLAKKSTPVSSAQKRSTTTDHDRPVLSIPRVPRVPRSRPARAVHSRRALTKISRRMISTAGTASSGATVERDVDGSSTRTSKKINRVRLLKPNFLCSPPTVEFINSNSYIFLLGEIPAWAGQVAVHSISVSPIVAGQDSPEDTETGCLMLKIPSFLTRSPFCTPKYSQIKNDLVAHPSS